ncbi:hypothetical protein [Salinisphaera orenii]|uniref:hypothetical protein n=1 Tax=Salinisphaera orenii TaxID=856731 RepID=UPI000DBE910A
MKTLDHQAVLDRVYQHFVVERQPAGFFGAPFYHQWAETGVDQPCAIGLFDTDCQLADPQFNTDCSVGQLHSGDIQVLLDVFDVDELSAWEMRFLSDIQETHDHNAEVFADDPDGFVDQMAVDLDQIGGRYALRPLELAVA